MQLKRFGKKKKEKRHKNKDLSPFIILYTYKILYLMDL